MEGMHMENAKPSHSVTGKKRKRIGKKVGNVFIIMLAASIVAVVALCVVMFRTTINRMLRDRCISGTSMLAYELSRADGTEDMNQLLDDLKRQMGCEFTIFEGDTRAYTTVIQNGQRATGTRLSSNLSNIVLQKGQSYVGKATILNEEYLCSYVPTKNANGQIDGLIFAGISSTDANQQTVLAVLLSVVAGFVAILICVLILVAYLRKQVTTPLTEITQAAKRLEQGDLGLASGEIFAVSVRSNDEVGELGQIFEATFGRLGAYIGEISSVLDSIAAGDLTNSAQQEYVGDFVSIKRSLEGIDARLNDTITQIKESAEQVAAGSEQVSNGAQAQAQGATEQASSVQEMSTTISEISENARKTSQATREAGQFVEQAGSQLGICEGYVKQLNEAMSKISNSSEEISKIISTIEDIAFQTNILALNAAVEAARAGTAGKGFAVVADEVRSLANKSDEAAKATKELIEHSIAAVTEGGDVVGKVTESLNKTSESAGGVVSRMSIVVEAVESQTTAIHQVTEGIDQISAVVQTSSATSEESAAASEELSSQANLLKSLISSFKLKGLHRR
ncbi:MAG: HAMP domain-containing protein [Clostridiales bacterium]|nr:HAMP domain-containing protein [Clostridiales bacterium]